MEGSQDYFINNYVHQDWEGVLPKHDITDSLQKALHIIHFGKKCKMNSVIQLLNLHKAFDPLQSKYLLTVLSKMGFGHYFLGIMVCSPTSLYYQEELDRVAPSHLFLQ